MAGQDLSQQDVTNLINQLLDTKDPAVVGLRKILKTKKEQGNDFAFREVAYDSFYVEGKSKPVFDENEKRVIELEKQIGLLQRKLGETRKKAEESVRESYQRGLQEGGKKGKTEGEKTAREEYGKHLQTIEQRIQSMFENLEHSKKEICANAHHVLLKLVFELAKKVIHAELKASPEIVLSVIKKALSYIADKERLIIRVAADDLETVTGNKDFWMPISERTGNIEIVPDEQVDKGGCIVESNSGIADARLGIQFEEVTDLVERVWENIHASDNQPARPDKTSEAEDEK
ncbi:MAG: hypothetical protein GF350_10375 [Chitinivibrionales bacterium]|nr:hypothetical protein [Chitinivibrionales bacterium]